MGKLQDKKKKMEENENPTKSHMDKRAKTGKFEGSAAGITHQIRISDFIILPSESQYPTSKHATKVEIEEASPKENEKEKMFFTGRDEIVLLKRMIYYAKSKNLPLPLSDLKPFYPFLKGKLSADFTNSQIRDKIRRLKEKFLVCSSKKSGVAPSSFSRYRASKVFMISKDIWAEKGYVDDNGGKNSDRMKGEEVFCGKYSLLKESLEWEEGDSGKFPNLDAVTENMHLIGSKIAADLEMKWMELRAKEAKIHSRKVTFKMELIGMVLNAINENRSSGK